MFLLQKKKNCNDHEVIDVFISLTVVIISQCIHTSNHHVVHPKYIPFSFVNYTLVKLGETGKPTHRVKDFAQDDSF